MTKKKVMLVLGTRPEAIKMAPVYHALKSQNEKFETLICVTAQHRQMLDQALVIFDITPDIDLNLMKDGQDLFDVTASVLLAMRSVLNKYKPDILLVHGDTTTAYSAAVAGMYLGIRVGHVEAGLRTYDISKPFPEEFNRQVISKIAYWHFAPTELCRKNLLNEGVKSSQIEVTGNTVIDSLLSVVGRFESNSNIGKQNQSYISKLLPFDFLKDRFVLITGHRRENFGVGFLNICSALQELALKFPNIHFVYPVHLNPNVQKPVNSMLAGYKNIHLIAPLDYEPFVYLLKFSYIVITDSGGIQEEAPSLGKPVLVIRDTTERPEAVQAGTVRLVGADTNNIIINTSELLENEVSYNLMSKAHNPYGDGHASERIVKILSAA